MSVYEGIYEERYQKKFKIEADSLQEAEAKARRNFGRNKYKVESSDRVDVTMELTNDEESTGVFHLYN